MTSKRVFVLWKNPLFYDSVRMLLSNPRLSLVGASSDPAVTWSEISELVPDVVIVERSEGGDWSTGELMPVLLEGTRVVSLSMNDNQLSIYRRQDRTVESGEDLLRLVLEALANDED